MLEGGSRAIVILALLALWCVIKIGCIGAAYWFETSFPATAQRVTDIYRERPRRCFIVGLVNVALGLFIVAILLNTEVLALLGLLLFAGLIATAILAYAPAYRVFAERMETFDAAIFGTQSQRILRSGLAAEALYMAPALGQALSFLTLLRGFGAVVLTWLTARRYKDAA